MTFRTPSHAEDFAQIDRYERIMHELVCRGMDPSLASDVIQSSTVSTLVAAIDRLDQTLQETAGSDGNSDRNTQAIPRRNYNMVQEYLDLRKQRRAL